MHQRTLALAIVQTKIYNEIHRKHNDRYQFVLFVIYAPTIHIIIIEAHIQCAPCTSV